MKLYKSEEENATKKAEVSELMGLNLTVLFRFALARTEVIIEKFYQLGCVNFLVKELSLEHELTKKHDPKKEVFLSSFLLFLLSPSSCPLPLSFTYPPSCSKKIHWSEKSLKISPKLWKNYC